MGIKVLHLIDSGGLYGAEMMLLDLVEEQVQTGLLPLILSVGTEHDGKKALQVAAEKRGLPVKQWLMKEGFNFTGGYKILIFARCNKFQILHSHGYKFNILLGIIPRFFRNIPVITTVHGYVHATYFSKMRLYQFFDRYSLKLLDAVVFVSALTQKTINLELKNASVINNGINMGEHIDSSLPEKTNISEAFFKSSFILGSFGRLVSEKGYSVLIHAFKKVVQVIPDSKLIIWGEGYLRETLEKLIQAENLSNDVILPGYTEHVACNLKRLDAMVISSYTEGLPIILLEAMKYKVPVVVTEVGAIPEVVDYGKCGYLVPPNDSDAMADKIMTLHGHRDEVSEEHVKHAYRRIVRYYSSHLMAKRYFKLYSSVA